MRAAPPPNRWTGIPLSTGLETPHSVELHQQVARPLGHPSPARPGSRARAARSARESQPRLPADAAGDADTSSGARSAPDANARTVAGDEERPLPRHSRQHTRVRRQKRAIRTRQLRTSNLTLQHRQLMAEQQDLGRSPANGPPRAQTLTDQPPSSPVSRITTQPGFRHPHVNTTKTPRSIWIEFRHAHGDLVA
jgi:hypothetical protein